MVVDTRQARLSDPAFQGYVLLRTTFVVAPILALRDFGLMVGALVLNRLVTSFRVTRSVGEFHQRRNLAA
jgi:hypothetical protein